MRLFKRADQEAEATAYLLVLTAGPPLLKKGQRELEANWKELAKAIGEESGRLTKLLGEVRLEGQRDLSNWPEIYREIALRECRQAGIDLDEERDSISFEPAGPTMGFIKIFIEAAS